MIYVDSTDKAEGQWINDNVRLLSKPYFDEKLQQWCALANAFNTLAIVELRVTQRT
jgi:hypothetical protein